MMAYSVSQVRTNIQKLFFQRLKLGKSFSASHSGKLAFQQDGPTSIKFRGLFGSTSSTRHIELLLCYRIPSHCARPHQWKHRVRHHIEQLQKVGPPAEPRSRKKAELTLCDDPELQFLFSIDAVPRSNALGSSPT